MMSIDMGCRACYGINCDVVYKGRVGRVGWGLGEVYCCGGLYTNSGSFSSTPFL